MQKRTLYISLLLVSCLLLFGFSYASAQTVTFQPKTVSRCDTTVVNITVDYTGELSAVEVIFEASGAYSSIDVDFASGFTNLTNRVNQDLGGGKYRLAAMKTTDGLDACVDFTGGVVVGEITFITSDVCDGIIDVIGSSVQAQ